MPALTLACAGELDSLGGIKKKKEINWSPAVQSGMQCGQFSIYVFKRFAPSTSWQQLPPASSCIFASSCFPCTSGRKVRYLLYLLLEPGCHKASFKEAHGLPPHSIQQKSTGSGARAGFNPWLFPPCSQRQIAGRGCRSGWLEEENPSPAWLCRGMK